MYSKRDIFDLLYDSCIYFRSYVLQNCFSGEKFRTKCKVFPQKHFVSRCYQKHLYVCM